MGRRIFPVQFIFGVLLLCAACTRKPPVEAASPELPPPPPRLDYTVRHSREADDLGRFLAGLPGREGSAFEALEQRAEWREHAQLCDHLWSSFEKNRLPAMREFAQLELDSLKAIDTVFYPFGGPDSLTVTTFFPHHPNYVLVGLEPPGTLVAPRRFQGDKLGARLAEMRTTLESLLGRSFFITRQMDSQLRGQITDGVLLDILVELVRSHYKILGMEEMMFNAEGKLAPRVEPTSGQRNRGIVLEIESEEDHSLHRMYYFSVNLANDRLAKNPQFFTTMLNGPKVVTFLKSTSYLLHQSGFSTIRDQILDHSATVLQDDSGIPYHFFTERTWKVQPYGEYEKPYGSFRYLIQKDLQQAFRSPDVKKLPFRIGYGFGRQPSNLILATAPAN